jgi:UDP-glucose:(heptosyl)LPS alpha-1,3-glucosyltransferase
VNKTIAIVIERADITLGGAERSVFELARALAAEGLEVHILAAKGATRSDNIHILCQDTPGKRSSHAAFAKAITSHLARNDYDIVHSVLPFDFVDVYQPRGGSYAEAIVRNAASYQNKWMVAYKRATAFGNFRRTALLLAERRLCRDPNGPTIAALSRYVAEQFKRHYDLADGRLAVIANGVRTNRPVDNVAAVKLRSQILARLGVKEAQNPVLFLFVANNFRLKGLTALLRATQSAFTDKAAKQAYLVVTGRDKAHKYRQIGKKLGLHEKVVFLGRVRHIQNALSITDVAVLPTFYDPSSRFTLEALAAGKPVITTRFNGATDLFVADRHGKVIDRPEDVDALADAIGYFADEKNIQKASHAIAADNLKENISVGRVAKQLITVYESILGKRMRK